MGVPLIQRALASFCREFHSTLRNSEGNFIMKINSTHPYLLSELSLQLQSSILNMQPITGQSVNMRAGPWNFQITCFRWLLNVLRTEKPKEKCNQHRLPHCTLAFMVNDVAQVEQGKQWQGGRVAKWDCWVRGVVTRPEPLLLNTGKLRPRRAYTTSSASGNQLLKTYIRTALEHDP